MSIIWYYGFFIDTYKLMDIYSDIYKNALRDQIGDSENYNIRDIVMAQISMLYYIEDMFDGYAFQLNDCADTHGLIIGIEMKEKEDFEYKLTKGIQIKYMPTLTADIEDKYQEILKMHPELNEFIPKPMMIIGNMKHSNLMIN